MTVRLTARHRPIWPAPAAGYQSPSPQSSNAPSNYSPHARPASRGNNYYLDSTDQDRNAYYGYRGPSGRMAMADSGGVPHLAPQNSEAGSAEMMPPGPMLSGMGPTMSGEHVMGPEWEGDPGDGPGDGPGEGPGCGCEGGGPSCGCGWRNGGCGNNGCCGSGNCNNCCCGPICQIVNAAMCGDWFHDFTAQVGVAAFRQPLDVAFNNTRGNFGFDEGFNWGIPLVNGFAGQAGMNFVQSDLVTGDFSDRSQVFFTGGVFYRNMGECGFQGGLVYDYLRDDWNGVNSGIDLGQLRGSVSYVMGCNEFGFWFTAGMSDSTATIDTFFEGQPGFVNTGSTIKPADIYALYYTRHFCGGGEARFFGGVANQLGRPRGRPVDAAGRFVQHRRGLRISDPPIQFRPDDRRPVYFERIVEHRFQSGLASRLSRPRQLVQLQPADVRRGRQQHLPNAVAADQHRQRRMRGAAVAGATRATGPQTRNISAARRSAPPGRFRCWGTVAAADGNVRPTGKKPQAARKLGPTAGQREKSA